MELRPTPKHIDRSSRAIEFLLVGLIPFVLVRPFFEITGLALMVALPLVYAKFTIGKPQGYLWHVAYRFGMPVRGLLPHGVKRFQR
jgi:hypothetical protein